MSIARYKQVVHAAIQHATLVCFPLVVMPHLIKILGLDYFGMLAICQAIVAFASVVVDYGYSIRGVVYVSQSRDDSSKLHAYLWTSIHVQLTLLLVTALVLIGLFHVLSPLRSLPYLLAACLLVPLGQALFCRWLYQGLERIADNTLAILASRTICIVLTFALVTERDDLILAAVLLSSGPLISAGIMIGLTRENLWLPTMPSTHDLQTALKEGWGTFTQQLVVAIYGNVSTIMLGVISSPSIAGAYSVCERIMSGVLSLFTPIHHVLFARLARTFNTSSAQYLSMIRRIYVWLTSAAGLFFVTITVAATPLLSIFVPQHEVANVLSTYSALSWLLLVGYTGPLLTQHLIILGRVRLLRTLVLLVALIHIALLCILVPPLAARGAAMAAVSAQLVLQLSLLTFLFSRFGDNVYRA
jgi:O-antigen/teichoic acid export membrane protein